MLRIVLVLGGFALTLYCLIDLWQTRQVETETLPRVAWIAIVVLVPFAGPVAWLIFGRPVRDGSDDEALTRR